MGSTLQTNAATLQDDLNGLRSARRHDLDPLGTLDWHAEVPTVNSKKRGFLQLNTNLDGLEEKIGPCYTNHANALTVTAGQNFKILSVAGNETPSGNGTVVKTAEGVAVALATLGGAGFGAHELVVIAGPDALHPVNLLELREVSTGERPQSVESRDIFGLLQAESTYTDGNPANDTVSGDRFKISFVKFNAAFNAFEAATVADIATKVVYYSYTGLKKFVNADIDCFLGRRAFVDHAGQADITLDRAIDNQGTEAATQTSNISVKMSDGVKWSFQDPSGGTDILSAIASAVQDSVAINGDLDVNNVGSADFAQGIIADSSDQGINIGSTTGQIDSAAALTVKTTVGDLILEAATELLLDDGYRASSSYSLAMRLADTAQEWSDYETNMAVLTGSAGEVSLLKGMNLLYTATQEAQAVIPVQSEVTSHAAPDVNLTGAGGTPNLDVQLPDYSTGTPADNFVNYFWIFHNGNWATRGANEAAGTDFYPGTAPATGDIKSNDRVKSGDQITAIYWGP